MHIESSSSSNNHYQNPRFHLLYNKSYTKTAKINSRNTEQLHNKLLQLDFTK